MARGYRAGAVALVALGAVAACGGPQDEHAGHQHTPPADHPAPASSGPKVPAPLDTRALLNDPCAALAPTQVDQLGMAMPGKPRQGAVGPECSWKSFSDVTNTASISPIVPNKGGISDIYALKGKKAYFEPTEISGYPAVYTNEADLRAQGNCPLIVGVTDQLAVTVTPIIFGGPNKAQPCKVAEKIATAMVEHAKGKA